MPHAPGGTTTAGPIGDKLRGGHVAVAALKPALRLPKEESCSPAAAITSCDVADRDGRTALHFACHCGHSDVVAALILAGCDVNTPDFSGHTALQRAAAEGHADIVQQLLKRGVQVDHQDDVHGNTALHEAVWKGFSQTVDSLCKAKANAYIRNKGGFVPLHLACQNGHNQSCRVLLWSGCRPDIKNNYGDTPLHTAARYGHAGVMRILISARANVNEKNKNGDTAVHISSAMGRRKLTRILLESGCDRNIQNKQGETAMDIARRKRFAEVGNILANPPPLRMGGESSGKQHKKREKESGTSKDSKDSGSRHKTGKTKKKSKRGHKGHHHHHHHHHHEDSKTGHGSPYGCQHYSAGVMPIQNLKLDTLPDEPLVRGEQYFLDLAGNIKKGPVGIGYACYCVPFFRNVQKKMENDKQELIEHIDLAHDNLNAKITHLERRTRTQLTTINEGMKERMAADKAECLERVDRAIINRVGRTSTGEVHTTSNARPLPSQPPTAHCSLRDEVSSTSEEEEDDEEEEEEEEEANCCNISKRCSASHRELMRTSSPTTMMTTTPTHLAAEVALAVKASNEVQFGRSRSEEILSADQSPIRRSRSGTGTALEAEKDSTTAVANSRDINRHSRMLSPHSNYRSVPYNNNGDLFVAARHHLPLSTDVRISGGGVPEFVSRNEVVTLKPVLNNNNNNNNNNSNNNKDKDNELDRDSGYTTKLHSSFESSTSTAGVQVPNLPPRTFSAHRCPPVGSTSSDYRELPAEFADIDGQFFYTVNNETEKWYERRLQSMERKTAQNSDDHRLAGHHVITRHHPSVMGNGSAAWPTPVYRPTVVPKPARPEPFTRTNNSPIRPPILVHSGNTSSLV